MNIKTMSVKVMSVVLSILMLFSAVYVGFTVFNDISADAAEVITYSAINQFTQGEGVAEGNWKFEIQDNMAATGLFSASSSDFAAPEIEPSSTSMKVTWQAYTNAVSYKVKLYSAGSSYSFLEEKQLSETECSFDSLTTGEAYIVQVLALNDQNEQIAASAVAKIVLPAPMDTTNFTVLNDMSDMSLLNSTFSDTALQSTNVTENYLDANDNTGLTFTTAQNKSITFRIPDRTDFSEYEAIAFYFESVKEWSFYDLKTGEGKRLTNALMNKNNPNNVTNFYLVTLDGGITNLTTPHWEGGWINIPANTKGYIVGLINKDGKRGPVSTGNPLTNVPFVDDQTPTEQEHFVTGSIVLGIDSWQKANTAANRNQPFYVDNLMAIKDVDTFVRDLGTKASVAAQNMEVGSQPILDADVFNSNTLSNAASGDAKYLLSYGNIGFRLTSSHGAKLTFTAPQDAYYEFNGNFFVRSNSAAIGTLKYKLVKTDTDGNETILWPTDGVEKQLQVTSDNKTPIADDLGYTRVSLKQGETLSIVTSMMFTQGSYIDVTLGAPVMFVTNEIVDNSKGRFVEYSWSPFSFKYSHKDDLGVSASDLVINQSSVDIKGFTYDHATLTATYGDETSYNPGWDHYLPFENGSALHSKGPYGYQAELNLNEGIAFQTVAPFSGKAIASFYGTGYLSIRVLVNGVTAYPTDSEWMPYSTLVTVSVDVNEGDSISYEIMRHAEGGNHPYLIRPENPETQVFRFMSGNTYNQASEDSYGAQLERPYMDRAHNGEFVVAPTSLFNFGALDVNSGTVVPADMYDDTNNNHMYNSVYDGAGFYFDDDERLLLDVTGSDSAIIGSGTGGAISFKAPTTGIYDVTTGLTFENGSGTANYRIVYEGEVVWPTDGGWYTVSSSEAKNVPAALVSATAGKEIVLQYAVSNNGNKTTLNLGAPTVYKVPATIPAQKGYMDVFAPALYEPKAVLGRDVVINKAGNRYEFYSLDASYNQTVLLNYNADTRILKSDDSSVALDFSTGEIVATLKANTGVSLKLDLPKGGLSNIYLKPQGDVKVRALVNGEVVADWTTAAADGSLGIEIIETELGMGDVVELQIFSESDQTVALGAPSVSVVGDHMVGNYEADEMFYPLNDDPYKGSAYTGEYLQPLRIWNFNTFNSTDPATLGPINYYDSTQDRYAYNTNMLNAGFKFATTGLKAVLTNDGTNYYGSSVEFIAPSQFDADLLWSFITENPDTDTGKLHVRITINDQVIWPADADWETLDFTGGDALDFPLYELSLYKGDSLKVELYASDTTANTVTVNMKFPVIKFTGKSRFLSPDAQADVYAIMNYNPYGETVYDGKHTPVESRWNFELLTYTATENNPTGALAESDTFGIKAVPNYKKSWNHYLMGDHNEGFHISSNGTNQGEIYNTIDGDTFISHGLSWRFVSPITGSAKLLGSPSPGNLQVDILDENQNVIGTAYKHYYFRILKNGETIWPTDSDWAHVYSENKSFGFTGLDLELEAGDEITCQLFMKVFDQDGAPVASSSGIIDLGNTSIVLVDPESVTTGKTRFNPSSDWTTNYQISPYWSYEVSYDNEVYNWQQISSWYSGFSMWRDTAVGQLGIARDYTWFYDGDGKHAALSRTLTIENDGYIQIGEGKATLSAALGDNPGAIIKIMCNDETWLTSTEFKSSYSYEKINKAVKAGDKIRFVMTLTEGTGTGWSTYIRWTPTISWSKRNFEATGDKNIFQGLNDTMLEFFKTLDSSTEFDIDFEANKYLAENPPQEEIISSSSEPVSQEVSSQDSSTSSKKGGKKTVTTYQIITGTPIWLIIVIIVGAVVLVGGIVTLLILKKKGIILAPKPDDSDDDESAEGIDDTQTNTEEN